MKVKLLNDIDGYKEHGFVKDAIVKVSGRIDDESIYIIDCPKGDLRIMVYCYEFEVVSDD